MLRASRREFARRKPTRQNPKGRRAQFDVLEDRQLLTTFNVDVSAPWRDTGIDVAAGQTLRMSVNPLQEVSFGWEQVNANGVGGPHNGTGKYATAVYPAAVVVSLIGKVGGSTAIGTGTPLPEGQPGAGAGFVGSGYSQVVQQSGRLFLGFNDEIGLFFDNSGSFTVSIDVIKTDLQLNTYARADGFSAIDVTYTIANTAAPAFEVGFYKSSNTVFDSEDQLLTKLPVNNSAELTVGAHTKAFTIGGGPGQIPLPGYGVAETDDDYHILVVLDPTNAIAEDDAHPFAEDNTFTLYGAYHPENGPVFVHGTPGGENHWAYRSGASGLGIEINSYYVLYPNGMNTVSSVRVRGHDGNDNFYTSQMTLPMFVLGGNGNDLINGGAGNDWIWGAAGNDTILGLEGNDSLYGGNENDTLIGGDGDDHLNGGAANDVLGGPNERGNDTLNGAAGNDTVDGGPGNDAVYGGDGNDQVFGGVGNDSLFSDEGNNLIDGQAGNDSIYGGVGLDTMIGGSGIDTLTGSGIANNWALTAYNAGSLNGRAYSAIERLTGGSASNVFNIGPAGFLSGKLDGGLGTDTISYASYGAPVLVNRLNSSATGVTSFSDIESIIGSSFADTLMGANSTSTWAITGTNSGTINPGAATALGFSSFENLLGGTKDDTFRFNNGMSVTGVIDGGEGVNTLDYNFYTTPVTVNLAAGTATGTVSITNIQDVIGGSGNDLLIGDADDNVLQGRSGNDTLVGGGGNDILVGGDGNDILNASASDRSVLIGGKGTDVLLGSAVDDILIAGYTNFDANTKALKAIMLEWKRTDATYAQRVDHIRGTLPGGLNGNTKLTNTTVKDDGASDTLTAGTGDDWFWGLLGEFTDKQVNESWGF